MIKSRFDIHDLLKKHTVKIGIELGVASGTYSRYLTENHNFVEYYGIDKWNDHHNEKEKNSVFEYFKEKKNVKIMHMSFDDALVLFPDNYFDFIYIDGYAHTGQNDGKTIRTWFDKLKQGGIFSGHDYCEKKWPKTYHQVNAIVRDEFGYEINKTGEPTESSWYIIK